MNRFSADKLLIAGCLIVFFVVFPIIILWTSRDSSHGAEASVSSGISTSSRDSPDATSAQLPENAGPPPLAPGTRAIDFASTTVDGKSYIFDSQSPHIKIVDFWATWCAPCRESIPTLEDLDKTLRSSGVETVGVSEDSSTANEVRPFAKAMGMNYTVLVDPRQNRLAAYTYNATGLPSLYIIDGKGIVRWSISGYWTDEEPYLRRVISEIQTGKPVE